MNPVYSCIQENRALAKIEEAQSSKNTKIDLIDYDLSTLPAVLLKYTPLKILNVGYNKIESFPEDKNGRLKNLQHLSLEHNDFTKFPQTLSSLPNLKSLNISHNKLETLQGVGDLISLEILWCNNCSLEKLPTELGELKNLDTFGARHNKIATLPDEITNLESLRWLTLEDNQISSLPEKFSRLKSLVHANFNKNCFTHLPVELASLENLFCLHMQHNLLADVSESVLNSLRKVSIHLERNPLNRPKLLARNYSNLIVTGVNDSANEEFFNSDSSSEDWDNSLDSADLNEAGSESDSEAEDILVEIPKLSKYLVTF